MFEASRNLRLAVDNLVRAILEAGLGKILDKCIRWIYRILVLI